MNTKRREFFASIACGVPPVLSGCLFNDGNDNPQLTVKLLSVAGYNRAEETKRLRIQVLIEQEIIEDTICSLEPGEECVLECTWPSTPEPFEIAAQLEGEDDWVRSDLTELSGDCAAPVIMVNENNSIDIPTVTDCDPSGETC